MEFIWMASGAHLEVSWSSFGRHLQLISGSPDARRGFGATLGSLWSHFGVILGSLGSLWVYESYFGVISGARLTHGFVEGALISHFWRSLGFKFSNYCPKPLFLQCFFAII